MISEHYSGLGHIAIYTTDLEESLAFYEKLGGSKRQTAVLHTPAGEKKLMLVELAGFVLELIEPPAGELVPAGEGAIPHIAIYVDDVDAAAAEIRAAGIHTFMTPEKVVLDAFGGLDNWFFTGPSGEQIELLRMHG